MGAVVVAALPWAGGSKAYACGGFFDVVCNLQHGGLSPQNIARQTQDTVQKVANAVNELQASTLSGPTLEQAINASRNSAIGTARPIPADMRQRLTGFVSADVLSRVRYKVGDNGFLNLARLLEQGGFASAVTLNDVVVFRGPTEAADPSIWAHELKHIAQYQDWGVHSFAVQYARNAGSVEDPAYAQGNRYWDWLRQNQTVERSRWNSRGSPMGAPAPGQPVAPPMAAPMPMPMPAPVLGSFCYTPFGRFGPGPLLPVGSPCWVRLPQGNFWGQIGQ